MAQLSDTTNQNGLVQRTEFWARLPYGSDGDQLREIITNINLAFDRVMPILLMRADHIRWDDINHSDAPIGYVNITSGQSDYKITTDDNSLDILNINHVRILPSDTDTDYHDLKRMTLDDPRVHSAMSPNSGDTGVPSHFVENAGKIFLYPEPDYTVSNGMEIFFGREQNRFTVTGTSGDDTTEPGLPKPFHELLAQHAALMLISVHRPDDANTIEILRREIKDQEEDLKNFIDLKNPTQVKMTMKPINHR